MIYVKEVKMLSCKLPHQTRVALHMVKHVLLQVRTQASDHIRSMKHYLVIIAGAQINSYSYIRFLFKIVGSMEKKPMRKSTDNVL